MSNDDFIDRAIPTDDDLKRISDLARSFVAAETHIRALEMELETVKKYHEQISTFDLPEAMNKVHMQEFKLTNGHRIAVIPVFNVRLTKQNIDKADKWLDDNGHGGMIKRKVEITIPKDFDKGDMDEIERFFDEIDCEYEVVKTVHWATIQSWATEMNQEGEVIPEEIFNVFRGNKTVISE